MEQFVASILGIFYPEYQVSAILGGFDRMIDKLGKAIERMESSAEQSFARSAAAYDKAREVGRAEAARRNELWTAIAQADKARTKLGELVGK